MSRVAAVRGGTRLLWFAGGALIALVLAGAIAAAGVFAVEAVGGLESPATWSRWADVGNAFGVLGALLSGLAFVALIVTLWIQFRELRYQRMELRLQRDAIERSSGELRRSADAGVRMLHFELMRMSIDNEELAAVWPAVLPSVDPRRNRQHLYANLVFQHMSLSMQVAQYTDSQVRQALGYLFASEIMRDYWRTSKSARARTQVPGNDHWRIAQIGDEVCAGLDAEAAAV
jgi:hypothetical protein